MARPRTTKDVYVVQQNYGYGHGWEDVVEEDTWKEAKQRLKEYRDNTTYPTRYVKRKEKLSQPNPVDARKVLKSGRSMLARVKRVGDKLVIQPVARVAKRAVKRVRRMANPDYTRYRAKVTFKWGVPGKSGGMTVKEGTVWEHVRNGVNAGGRYVMLGERKGNRWGYRQLELRPDQLSQTMEQI